MYVHDFDGMETAYSINCCSVLPLNIFMIISICEGYLNCRSKNFSDHDVGYIILQQ